MTEETVTCIKVCCDASATILSLIAIIISVIALINNSKKNKSDTLLILKGYINDARSNLSSVSLEIDKNATANDHTEIQNAAFEEAQERLLNAYETACERFFKKEIDPKDFSDNFADDITTFVQNPSFATRYFNGLYSRFYYIKKYYINYIEKKSSKR